MRASNRKPFQEHHSPRMRELVVRGLLALAFSVVPVIGSFASDALSQLPPSLQPIVERICLPIQYQQGSDAYRDCLTAEIASRGSLNSAADGQLPVDEQFAIQRSCAAAGVIGSTENDSCVEQQLALLNSEPAPQWQGVSDDEKHVIQQACADVQADTGVQAYRRCVNEAQGTLKKIPVADLSKLSLADKNTLQQECLGRTNDARDYRQCLLNMVGSQQQPMLVQNQLGEVSETRDAVTGTAEIEVPASSNTAPADAASRQENSVSSTLAEAAASLSEAAASLSDGANDPDQQGNGISAAPVLQAPPIPIPAPPQPAEALASVSSNTPAPAAVISSQSSSQLASQSETDQRFQVADLLKNLQLKLNNLSGTKRIFTVAALALPLLLIISWFVFRKREGPVAYENAYTSSRQDAPVHPQPASTTEQNSSLLLREQADSLFNEEPESTSASHLPNEEPTSIEEPRNLLDPVNEYESEPTVKMNFSNASPAKSDSKDHFDRLFDSVAENSTDMKYEQKASNFMAGEFGQWLVEQPEQKKLSFAIEFLIYWFAYADERYEPSLRSRVFKMEDPDEHTRIKRWVLQMDVYSFSDSVRWLQANASDQQRFQIIDLLIALLVSEKAMTPIQNTLFRFLGDAFGLGHVKLDSRFRRAFDQSLPQLPRVDKPVWWQSQSEEQRFRWNARAVAKKPADIQHRVKLGLPLTGELRPAEIASCYQRAAARCHPKHFQLLGERELSMVERQMTKFEAARDALLETIT